MSISDATNKIYLIPFTIIVIVFVGLTFFHSSLKTLIDSNYDDFGNYYFYSSLMRNGTDIYRIKSEQEAKIAKEMRMLTYNQDVNNAPFVYLIITPLTFIKYKVASFVWFLLNNVLFLLSLLIIISLARDKLSFDLPTMAALFMAFSFQPLQENIWSGNLNIFVLFLLAVSFLFLKEGKGWLGGIPLAIVFMIKHQFGLVLLLFFLWKKEYSLFLSTLFTALILGMGTLQIVGLPLHFSYLDVLIDTFAAKRYVFNPVNVSMSGFAYRLFGVTNHDLMFNLIAIVIYVFSFSMIAYTAYVAKQHEKSPNLLLMESSLIIPLILIISPVVHEPHYLILLFPVLLFWYCLGTLEMQKTDWILFIVSYLLIGMKYSLIRFPVFHIGALSFLYASKLIGVFLLYILGVRIINKYKNKGCAKHV